MKRRSLFALFSLPLLGLFSRMSEARSRDAGLRRIMILKDGKWVDGEWQDLKEGVTFRMFESTGGMVVETGSLGDPTVFSAWIATKDAEPLPKNQGSWCVQVEGHPEYIVT